MDERSSSFPAIQVRNQPKYNTNSASCFWLMQPFWTRILVSLGPSRVRDIQIQAVSVSCISATQRGFRLRTQGALCSLSPMRPKTWRHWGSKVDTGKPVTTHGDSVEYRTIHYWAYLYSNAARYLTCDLPVDKSKHVGKKKSTTSFQQSLCNIFIYALTHSLAHSCEGNHIITTDLNWSFPIQVA